MALEQGVIDGTGFAWARATRQAVNAFVDRKDGADPMIVIMPETRLHDAQFMRHLEHEPKKAARDISNIGFHPVDTDTLFPGEMVSHAGLEHDFDMDAWLRSMVEVPKTVDLTIVRDRYTQDVTLIATTERKGRTVKLKSRPPRHEWIIPHVRKILEEWSLKAPRPAKDTATRTVGAHMAMLMTTMDRTGQNMMKAWLAKQDADELEQQQGYTHKPMPYTLPGHLFIGADINKVVLKTTDKSRAVHAKIETNGLHLFEDDESGTTVTLHATLPETVLAAMPRRSVGEVVECEWLKPLKIRTTPKADHRVGTITMRAFADNMPIVYGTPVLVEEAEQERRLRHAVRDGGRGYRPGGLWSEIDTALVPVLGALSEAHLAEIFARLEFDNTLELDEYGLEGWMIRGQGPRIVIEQQPALSIGELPQLLALGIAPHPRED